MGNDIREIFEFLIDLPQLLGIFLQLFFRLLALGDVLGHADDPLDIAIASAHDRRREKHGDPSPVAPPVPAFLIADRTPGKHLLDPRCRASRFFSQNEAKWEPDHFLLPVPQQKAGGLVQPGDGAFRRHHDERIHHAGHDVVHVIPGDRRAFKIMGHPVEAVDQQLHFARGPRPHLCREIAFCKQGSGHCQFSNGPGQISGKVIGNDRNNDKARDSDKQKKPQERAQVPKQQGRRDADGKPEQRPVRIYIQVLVYQQAAVHC